MSPLDWFVFAVVVLLVAVAVILAARRLFPRQMSDLVEAMGGYENSLERALGPHADRIVRALDDMHLYSDAYQDQLLAEAKLHTEQQYARQVEGSINARFLRIRRQLRKGERDPDQFDVAKEEALHDTAEEQVMANYTPEVARENKSLITAEYMEEARARRDKDIAEAERQARLDRSRQALRIRRAAGRKQARGRAVTADVLLRAQRVAANDPRVGVLAPGRAARRRVTANVIGR